MTEKEVNLFRDGGSIFSEVLFHLSVDLDKLLFWGDYLNTLFSITHVAHFASLYVLSIKLSSCFPLLVGVTQQEPVEPVVEGEDNEAVLLVSCRFITHIRHIRHCWLCNKYTAWRNIYTICTKCSRYPRNDTKCWRKCTFTP